jgi:hypothetical protein
MSGKLATSLDGRSAIRHRSQLREGFPFDQLPRYLLRDLRACSTPRNFGNASATSFRRQAEWMIAEIEAGRIVNKKTREPIGERTIDYYSDSAKRVTK